MSELLLLYEIVYYYQGQPRERRCIPLYRDALEALSGHAGSARRSQRV